MDKYKNKYRISSARLQTWDYGWSAAYFITICTKYMNHYFGEIENGEMKLSKVGVIADVLWHEIKKHHKNILLDAFVVMPNHIHGILILNDYKEDDTKNKDNIDNYSNSNINNGNVSGGDRIYPVSTEELIEFNKKLQAKTPGEKRFRNQGKRTVSSIIGSYKAAVTRHCRRLDYDFNWQERFYDHIIRNEHSFKRIAEYIYNNPKTWKDDKYYKGLKDI